MAGPGRTTTGSGRGGISMGVRFLLLSAACVSLMILDQREHHLVRVRQALSFLVTPVQLLVDAPISGWNRLRDNLSTQKSLLGKVQTLERDKLNAEFRLQRLAALERENERLRGLLDSQARVGSRALIAEILDVDLD